MAGTTIKAAKTELPVGTPRSANHETTAQHNAAVVDLDALAALVAQLRALALYNVFGNPGFQRVSNFDVNNATAFFYTNGGTLKTFGATTTFDTGTTATIASARWGAALLSINSSGSAVVTWFTDAGAGYATEAAAIAAMTAASATDTVVGYITVLAAGSTWTAGTDALASGTGGTPATTTNYYNSINPNTLYVGAAVTVTAAKVADVLGTVIS